AYADAGQTALGIVTSPTHFVAVADLAADLPNDLIAILESDDGLARLKRAVEAQADSAPARALASVTLKPFLSRPNAIWALALNFKTHIAETGLQTSLDYPHLFMRTAASLVGAGEPIWAPRESVARAFDYEGELAVVIGKSGRYIPVEQALEHV